MEGLRGFQHRHKGGLGDAVVKADSPPSSMIYQAAEKEFELS